MTIEQVAQAYFDAVTAHDTDAVAACFADDGELITATASVSWAVTASK